MITYETIKEMAKEGGVTVADLCALSPKNDPFYTGRPSEVVAAEWFTRLWQKFGYGQGVHLRRVHYQIVSQNPPVARPDGSRYENTENCWDYLNEAAKWARYLRLVSPAAFVDRRNPEAVINAHWPEPDDWDYTDPTPAWAITTWDDSDYQLPDLPDLPGLLSINLEAVDINPNDYPLPDVILPEEDDDTLYNSQRDYLDQLRAYKAQRLGAVAD
jgi:hypothetical protein